MFGEAGAKKWRFATYSYTQSGRSDDTPAPMPTTCGDIIETVLVDCGYDKQNRGERSEALTRVVSGTMRGDERNILGR
jgi:hypothetical protein